MGAKKVVRAIKRDPISTIGGGALGGLTGFALAARQSSQSAKKENTLKGQISAEKARSQEEIARQKAIADESVRKQKEKARRQLIFAGNAQNNLFSPTLGGIGGQQTLG